jgi:putative membrane protein
MVFSVFAAIIGEGVNMLSGAPSGRILLAVLGVILVVVVVAGISTGIQALAYKNLYYALGPEEFNLYSGILTKRRVHIPYQRIQSVNQRMTLLQRVFGVCTLHIDTAGGAHNKAVVVPYVQKSEAERLRRELFARKQAILSGFAGQAGQTGEAGQVGKMSQAGQAGVAQWGTAAAPSAAAAPTFSPTNVLDAPAEIIADVRGVFGGNAVDTGAPSYEYGMSNKELVLTGLSNNTGFIVFVCALIGGVMSTVGYAAQTALGQSLMNEGVNWVMGVFAENLIPSAIVAILIVLAVIWAFSIVSACVSYGGFRARRRATRIEVEHGLLQHQFHGVDIDRVQSVIIKQGFIRRIFGYCELSLGKIDALAADSSEQQKGAPLRGLVIHPFVKLDRVPTILAGLVPEFAGLPTQQIKLPAVALRRALVRRCIIHGSGFWFAVVVAALQVLFVLAVFPSVAREAVLIPWLPLLDLSFIILYALCVVIFIVEIVGSFFWYRGSSFAYNRRFMQITNGGFSRECVSFPRRKIQFGTVRSNPLQRRSRVATISARTAAGIAGTSTRLLDASAPDADSWLEWLVPGGNRNCQDADSQ